MVPDHARALSRPHGRAPYRVGRSMPPVAESGTFRRALQDPALLIGSASQLSE